MRPLNLGDFVFLLHGLLWTVVLSFSALAAGGVVAALLVGLRLLRSRVLDALVYGYVGLFQGTPLLGQLLFFYFGLSIIGFDVEAFAAAVFTLSLYAAAFLSEIWRGAIVAVPRQQWEAGESLGLGRLQTLLERRPAAGDALGHSADGRLLRHPHQGFLARLGARLHRAHPGGADDQQLDLPLLHHLRDGGGSLLRAVLSDLAAVAPARGEVPPLTMIDARDVRKRFGALEVLKGVSLDVAPGERVALLGRSGSGKSTFLRCLNGLEFDRRRRAQRRRRRPCRAVAGPQGAPPQGRHRLPELQSLPAPHRRAERDARPAEGAEALAAERPSRVAGEVLSEVGLADKLGAYPSELSGGQQQRVAIARSLALSPALMLFDEITSALDPELIGEVVGVLERLARHGDITMVLVTHQLGFARSISTRVVFMHQGLILEDGPTETVLNAPQTAEFKGFLSAVLT